MSEPLAIEEILKHMRETVGALAQENAVLKTQIDALSKANDTTA